ncbi:Putative pyrimidine permease RutG [Ephemeroptericola cinctiostellae]|uniref:Pyrimidine permease RutG n=1 Tax=Ephemeroptericola cinctiostellae TaxID=2268024 RepID=A0A345DCD1_9BURK|nr:solute carrier family 23 protein [Ephemeroptericola cinctiostellae]AXF86019.1 Putative pyrimidine permease RutG [Ephemeroptericola cinctiostellae]
MSFKLFPHWVEKHNGIIAPDERLPVGQTALMGLQHAVSMFGATMLAPLLMGFDPNVAILMSGVGTLLFFLLTRGEVPSYLGSSFAFIAPVGAATGYKIASFMPNPNMPVALGGIIVCGLLYAAIGFLIKIIGHAWVEKIMPPVVTGSIVAVIGLNLASVAVMGAKGSNSNAWYMAMTVTCVAVMSVFTTGMLRRLLVLFGLLTSTLLYGILVNGLGWRGDDGSGVKPIDFSKVKEAVWVGLPHFSTPTFDVTAMLVIVPVAVILVAENLGHLRAVQAITGREMDSKIGVAFMADGLATMLSGAVGGTGVTTYAENIGVMAVTKIYSTLAFVFAGLFAILIGFSPKMGALIQTIPDPVMGGISIVVFGLIAVTGAKIWVDHDVDFSQNKNLTVAAVTLIIGAGNFGLSIGDLKLDGMGVATFAAVLLNALFKLAPKFDLFD